MMWLLAWMGASAEASTTRVATVLLNPPARRVHDRHRTVHARIGGAQGDPTPLLLPGFERAASSEEADLVVKLELHDLVLGEQFKEKDDDVVEIYYVPRLEGRVVVRIGVGIILSEPVEVERRFSFSWDEEEETEQQALSELTKTALAALVPEAVANAGGVVAAAYGRRTEPHPITVFGTRRRGPQGQAVREANRTAVRGYQRYLDDPESAEATADLRAAIEGWESVLGQLDPNRRRRDGRLVDFLHFNVGNASIWTRDYDRARHHLFAAYGSRRRRFGEEGAGMTLANTMDEQWTAHARAQASAPDGPVNPR